MKKLTDLQGASAPWVVTDDLAAYLNARHNDIAALLPDHLTPRHVIASALNAIAADDRLQQAPTIQLARAIFDACRLGLLLDPALGHAFLRPGPDGRVDCLTGWRGLVDLVQRTGRANAWTGAVYVGDELDYALGSSPYLIHRMGDHHGDPAYLTHAYAIGRLHNSDHPIIEVWTLDRIERHRELYVGNDLNHYSHFNLDAYARKLPLAKVIDYLPRSTEIAQALAMDAAAENRRAERRAPPPASPVDHDDPEQDRGTERARDLDDNAGADVRLPAQPVGSAVVEAFRME